MNAATSVAAARPHLSAKEIADQQIARNYERTLLATSLTALCLNVQANLEVPAAEASIKVVLTAEHPHYDLQRIQYLTDQVLRWRMDTHRLSNYRMRRENRRLRHEETGAVVLLIIEHPLGETFQFDDAA